MNFKIGGECLCIKTHSGINVDKSQGTPAFFKVKKYPVMGLKQGCEHYPLLIDIGIESNTGRTGCSQCKKLDKGNWWDATKFVPIDNTLSDTTVEELLEEPLTQY